MTTTIAGLPAATGLPDDASPVSAVAVVQAIGPDGSWAYYRLATKGTGNVEAIGMHEAASALYKHALTKDT